MSASALLLGASVASLNLCTDEYLLLLAKPQEIASVSYLSHDPQESPLWRLARRHHANHGSVEQVIGHRPSLVLTMGGGGRATALLAQRLRMRVVDLPPASTLGDVETNLRRVAGALGAPARAQPWVQRLRQLRASAPRTSRDTIWLTGGGDSLSAGSLGSEWLRLAGLEQRALLGGRASLETLLTRPPQVLIRSNYRLGQVSLGTRWLQHPAIRLLKARQVSTDGRRWTCMGPLLIEEIERLRKVTA